MFKPMPDDEDDAGAGAGAGRGGGVATAAPPPPPAKAERTRAGDAARPPVGELTRDPSEKELRPVRDAVLTSVMSMGANLGEANAPGARGDARGEAERDPGTALPLAPSPGLKPTLVPPGVATRAGLSPWRGTDLTAPPPVC
jgi:hypothetical protein